MSHGHSPYWTDIVPAALRLLGHLNRVPGSPAAGSFSRDAWLYRFGGRFHPATRQCAVYPLARLYAGESEGNPFFGSPALLGWLRESLSFTVTLQNRDGSFAEWYPGQPSYCATAYLAACLSETIRALPEGIGPGLRNDVLACLDRASSWIRKGWHPVPGNQRAAAILALQNCSLLIGSSWRKSAVETRDLLLSGQSPDGHFPEYGGADLGYQSLSLDFLIRAADRGLEGLDDAVECGMEFLDAFVFPDGSSPAALSWRGTNFLSPFGVERRAAASPPARRLAARVRSAVAARLLPTPATADDRYAAHFFLPSFVDAHFAWRPVPDIGAEEGPGAAPAPRGGEIIRVRGDAFLTQILARKGSLAVFSNDLRTVIWDDHGYCLAAGDGIFVPEPSGEPPPLSDGEYVRVSGFRRVAGDRGIRSALFPPVALAAGILNPGFRKTLESRVKKAAFTPGKSAPVTLRRTISFDARRVRIADRVGAGRAFPSRLYPLHDAFPSNHPSSHTLTAAGLRPEPIDRAADGIREAAGEAWERDGVLESVVTFEKSDAGIRLAAQVNGSSVFEDRIDASLLR